MESGVNPERARRRKCFLNILLRFLPQKIGQVIRFLKSEKAKNITQVEILFNSCFSLILRVPECELKKI